MTWTAASGKEYLTLVDPFQRAKDYAFVVRACLNNNRCPGITVCECGKPGILG
jgi:hypothetical protein